MAIEIVTAAYSLPHKVLTNRDLEKMVDTTDEWIVKRVGIRERRVYEENESIVDSLLHASHKILNQSGLDPTDINLIIVASSTPQQIMPSTACILQGKLGTKDCIAFDLQAACTGFVYACSVAYTMMKNNPNIKHALVFGCEVLSRITNWDDRSTCVLFGDGAGGVLLSHTDNKDTGIIDYHLGSDGVGRDHLGVLWGTGQGYDKLTNESKYIYMNGREVYKVSIDSFVYTTQEILKSSGYTLDQVDWIIPHQANIRIIEAVARKLNVDNKKLITTIDKFGNTSAASIPMAFGSVIEENTFTKGDLVLFIGFGAGFTWGSLLFRF